MTSKNDALLERLLAMFRVEADAHLQAMSSGLLALEEKPLDTRGADIIEAILRGAHSLKGAARAVNFTQIEAVCRSLENVFSALKDKSLTISSPLIDLLLQTIDALSGLVARDGSMSGTQKSLLPKMMRQLDDILKRPLHELGSHTAAPQAAPLLPLAGSDESTESASNMAAQRAASAASHASATIRVPIAKLEAILRQVEELLLPRLGVGQRAKELSEVTAALAAWKKQRLQIQSAMRIVDRELTFNLKDNRTFPGKHELPKLLKYLDAEPLHMKALESQLARLQRAAEQDHRTLAGMTDYLLQDVKEMQLLPFSTFLDILPRFSRELAREQGKSLELVIRGGEMEIDRHILEEMRDPLIHLVRNCIDHGIEQSAARLAKGKPSYGKITFSCSRSDSGTAEILVTDDGAGINVAMVKAAARKLGVASPEEMEQLGEVELMALAFQSGVTTSPIVTDISGRGLGLAIVREKVEGLGGSIVVTSNADTGTVFRILLPLTLANTRGVLVHVGGQLFVIPSNSVERVLLITNSEIQTMENRETILVDEQPLSLVWLSDVLELRPRVAEVDARTTPAVVLGSGLGRIVFLVEEILGEQEILIKGLVRPLTRVRNVTGVCVVGTGLLAPVLDVPDLLKSAVSPSAAVRVPTRRLSAEKHETSSEQSILVVEDSITARTLLKHILESAGYRVTTAVDGVDGYTALKTGAFDLVVSDVEMPRMDGFALTTKIRADKQLPGLPVVLVTALDSQNHRERGIEAGANAYIVKSNFDQSNLLEVIRRLISLGDISSSP